MFLTTFLPITENYEPPKYLDALVITSDYQYTITLVACVIIFFDWFCKWSVYNRSNSKRILSNWNLQKD